MADAKLMKMTRGNPRHKLWQYAVAIGSVAGICLSLLGFLAARKWEDHYSRSDFGLQSENRVSVIRRELESNLSALNSVRGFAEIVHPLNQATFSSFATRILQTHPSMRAVEWLERVPASRRAAFEEALRSDNAPLPFINEGTPASGKHAAEREEYYPVRFLYPRNAKNETAIGFNFAACKSCEQALRAADATDRPAATVKFHILEHTGDGFAVSVVLPVRDRLQNGAPIVGYAMALVQVGDVVERAVSHLNVRGINIQLYDQDAAPGNRLLYFHRSRQAGEEAHPLPENAPGRSDGFQYVAPLTVAGRRWTLICTPTAAYLRSGRSWRPWVILFGGLLATFALATFFVQHRLHLSRLEMTNELLNEQIQVRLQAESALAAARDQALAASRMKSQFLATMSHEIRTPMNGVLGMTHLLLDTALTADQREFAGSVQRSAEALLAVINDILDLSRIEAGRISVECSTFDLRRTVEDVVRVLSPRAREKGISLAASFPSGLLPHFLGDELRVRQIVMNLVGNAVKFTDAGEVAVSVQCQEEPERCLVRIAVRDTGIGIPRDKLELLFQKFSQVDSSDSRRFGGTGLGLAISKELVELLGGKIGVESAPHRGSTFWFTLPLRVALAPAPAPRPEPALELTGPFAGSPPRVLVAEDNPINLRVATVMLERMGIRAAVAVNGLEAIRQFAEQPFDIILMDCQMPEMDGYAATAAIRRTQDPGHPPVIIAMTADAMEGTRERCLASGMDDYLAKPVNRGSLIETLNRWTGVPASSKS